MPETNSIPFPDGIEDHHATETSVVERHASPLSILLLGGLLIAALLGVFGGGKSTVRTVETRVAMLSVATPNVTRNGIFFETRIRVDARENLADATIAIPPSLWRDMTINAMIPAASDETFKDGTFRFHYGALKAGETLDIKIDGQINPPLVVGTKGSVALFDGDRQITAIPLSIKVLP